MSFFLFLEISKMFELTQTVEKSGHQKSWPQWPESSMAGWSILELQTRQCQTQKWCWWAFLKRRMWNCIEIKINYEAVSFSKTRTGTNRFVNYYKKNNKNSYMKLSFSYQSWPSRTFPHTPEWGQSRRGQCHRSSAPPGDEMQQKPRSWAPRPSHNQRSPQKTNLGGQEWGRNNVEKRQEGNLNKLLFLIYISVQWKF